MSKKFTKRVNDAVDTLVTDSDLKLVRTRSRSMFSPILENDEYVWAKVMDSDGLLVGRRIVSSGEGRDPDSPVSLTIGVVLQSEDLTSQTKPNPLGKAALEHIPQGVWVDLMGVGRVRLDCIHVLLVTPRGAAASQKKKFQTAKRNTTNAAAFMPGCEVLEVPRGIAASTLADKIKAQVATRFGA